MRSARAATFLPRQARPAVTRAASRSRLAWPLALVLLTVTSLLPARWLGLAGDLSSVINVALAPIGHLGNSIGAWLHPPPTRLDEFPPRAREYIENLEAAKAQAELEYRRMAQRNLELEEQIRQLTQAGLVPLPPGSELVFAPVVGRSPTDSHGPVRLRAGEREGARPGIIAVHNGIHLLGRVTTVDRFTSLLTPITNRATGGLSGLIFPPDRSLEVRNEDAPAVRLVPEHDGTLRGDVDRDDAIELGDVVMLSDPAWPASAQFRIVGEVTAVRPRDDQPLRERVVVRPRFVVGELAAVTLVVERPAGSGGRPVEPGPATGEDGR